VRGLALILLDPARSHAGQPGPLLSLADRDQNHAGAAGPALAGGWSHDCAAAKKWPGAPRCADPRMQASPWKAAEAPRLRQTARLCRTRRRRRCPGSKDLSPVQRRQGKADVSPWACECSR